MVCGFALERSNTMERPAYEEYMLLACFAVRVLLLLLIDAKEYNRPIEVAVDILTRFGVTRDIVRFTVLFAITQQSKVILWELWQLLQSEGEEGAEVIVTRPFRKRQPYPVVADLDIPLLKRMKPLREHKSDTEALAAYIDLHGLKLHWYGRSFLHWWYNSICHVCSVEGGV